MTDIVPAGSSTVVAGAPKALATPATAVATRPAAPVVPARPASPVPANLSAFSVLDLIGREMARLNEMLSQLGEQLVPLQATAAALDANVSNVDEACQIFQAPAVTRSATDAANTVVVHLNQMSRQVGEHTYRAQELNAAAFIALSAMREAQDRQRAMGAGPALLRDAGRR